jgi:hypothetical protein
MAYPRVLLADDSPQMLDEIAHLHQEGFEIGALTRDGREGREEQAKSHAATSVARFLSDLPVCSKH